ncbi:MAG TPA: hydrophobe/amphiphile efflux-1 family RND transporter, partial [Candidatus Accumulibacter sp.]|nr:hydrophobe/amphiphile efflux-1 family RND transporter [Accumulibacter sp.]
DQIFQFTLNALGRLSGAAQFEDIVVKSEPPPIRSSGASTGAQVMQTASLVRLKDVARVELSQQAFTVFSSLNGKKTAHVAVFALPGANALQVAGEARALMAEMSKVFPPGLEYTALYDTTVFIRQSISAVYETLIEAGALVLL